jgi:hypothetical protein
MSNIPRARELVSQVIQRIDDKNLKQKLINALGMMTRAKYIRKARPVHQEITDAMRRKVWKLNPNLNLTQVDIARRTGLRNPARVSEILNEKR